jgi:hypothetical protein
MDSLVRTSGEIKDNSNISLSSSLNYDSFKNFSKSNEDSNITAIFNNSPQFFSISNSEKILFSSSSLPPKSITFQISLSSSLTENFTSNTLPYCCKYLISLLPDDESGKDMKMLWEDVEMVFTKLINFCKLNSNEIAHGLFLIHKIKDICRKKKEAVLKYGTICFYFVVVYTIINKFSSDRYYSFDVYTRLFNFRKDVMKREEYYVLNLIGYDVDITSRELNKYKNYIL